MKPVPVPPPPLPSLAVILTTEGLTAEATAAIEPEAGADNEALEVLDWVRELVMLPPWLAAWVPTKPPTPPATKATSAAPATILPPLPRPLAGVDGMTGGTGAGRGEQFRGARIHRSAPSWAAGR